MGESLELLGWNMSVANLRFDADYVLVDVDAAPAKEGVTPANPEDLRFGLYGALAHPIEANGIGGVNVATETFSTQSPNNLTQAYFTTADNSTVGVGQTVGVKFDERIARVREGKRTNGQAAMATFERTRPTVGAMAVGVARAAYEYALDYACEREQFGRKIGEFQGVAFKLADMKARIDAARLLVYRAGWMARNGKAFESAEGSMAKLVASETAVYVTDEAIQILGGHGYTREYPVEQYYRDNRLNPIHEGTHGIQSLDLLGRKVTQNGGAAMRALAARITDTVTRAGDDPLAAQLADAWQRLVEVTATMFAGDDPAVTMANSAVYLEAFGHIVIAWVWLEQHLATFAKDGDFYEGKRQAARFFYRYELPKVYPQLDLLASLDRTTLDMQSSWF